MTSSKPPLGAINFKYDANVSGYDSDTLATDASYYIWDNMVNTINYIKSINKMSAFSDTSQTGEISYATVTPIKIRFMRIHLSAHCRFIKVILQMRSSIMIISVPN